MDECGKGGPMINWFKNYLTLVYLKVCIWDTKSKTDLINYSPLRYIIQVISMCNIIKSCNIYVC